LDESSVAEALLKAGAATQSAKLGRTGTKPRLRVRHSEPGPGFGLTQKEVAILLNLSERGVREIERRAFRKLLNHPSLRQVWRQYLTGELDEHQTSLTTQEISALFKLVRSTQEWLVLEKVTRLIRG
jgi:hypothetical protein